MPRYDKYGQPILTKSSNPNGFSNSSSHSQNISSISTKTPINTPLSTYSAYTLSNSIKRKWPIINSNNNCLFEALAAYFYFSANESDCARKVKKIMEKYLTDGNFKLLEQRYHAIYYFMKLADFSFNSIDNLDDKRINHYINDCCQQFKNIMGYQGNESLPELSDNIIEKNYKNDNLYHTSFNVYW